MEHGPTSVGRLMTRNARGPVVFRCDVGAHAGVGHLMRCLALAEEFRSRGIDVVFSAAAATVPLADRQLRRRNVPCIPAPESADGHRRMIEALDPSLVVIDSYRLTATVYEAVRSTGVPVLAIVDAHPGGREADVYLNPNLGGEAMNTNLLPGSTFLGGLGYSLMRDEVLAGRELTKSGDDGNTPRVLAFFGGTDPFGAAPVLARKLISTGLPFEATVVASDRASVQSLRALPARTGQHVTVIGPTSRLVAELQSADAVISASGTSSLELMCLGKATGLVCVTGNQEPGYAGLIRTGGVLGLGFLEDLRTTTTVPEALLALLSDPDRRVELRERARQLVDGHGRRRVVDVTLTALAEGASCA